MKITPRHLGVNEQEAEAMGTQWHFSWEERGEGGRDLQAACHPSALISHHGHESASVTGGRAAAEMGESRATLLAPVPYFATSFDVQGRAWIIIYFPSWHGANGRVSVSPLTAGT